MMTNAPVWNGEYFSAPLCTFFPKPSCLEGFETKRDATWDGARWSDPICVKVAPRIDNNSIVYRLVMEKVQPEGPSGWVTIDGWRVEDYTKKVFSGWPVYYTLTPTGATLVERGWERLGFGPIVWGNGAVTRLDSMTYVPGINRYTADFSEGEAYIRSIGCEPAHDWQWDYGMGVLSGTPGWVPWASGAKRESNADNPVAYWVIEMAFVCPNGVLPKIYFN